MTHASSEEEIKAMRSDFGLRLSSSMAKYGPLCVGIDRTGKTSLTGGITSTRKARSCSPCACFRPCETAPPLSNSRSPCSSATVQGIRGARTSALRRSSNGHHHHRGLLHGGLSTTISAIADAYFKPGALCWPTPSPCCRTMAHARCGASPMRPSTTVAASSSPP